MCNQTGMSSTDTMLVWWSSAHTYKNAITNELFLYTSAEAYLRFGDAKYLANAQKVCASVRMLCSSLIRSADVELA